MSEIIIERAHCMGLEELRGRLGALESKLRERLGVSLEWVGETAHFNTRGVSGSLALAEGSVAVRVQLSMLLRPMAAKIREGLERSLDRALA